jgi:hypothetical protein
MEIEPYNFPAFPLSRRDDDTPTDAATTVVPKKGSSGKAAAENEPSLFSSRSSAPVPAVTVLSTPERGSASETSKSQTHTSINAHHPHSDAGQTNTHKAFPSHLPPSLPSPENPPNHILPPPHEIPHHVPPSPPSKGLSATAIAFIVLGAIFAIFLTYIAAKCCYSWRRAPRPDRINDVMSRHFLDREMEEREREDLQRRWMEFRSSLGSPAPYVPPPPPYIHAPSYEDATPQPCTPVAERV